LPEDADVKTLRTLLALAVTLGAFAAGLLAIRSSQQQNSSTSTDLDDEDAPLFIGP